ncbi:hypothetical protein BZG20_15815, partial [Salinivibrio sp. IB868]
MVENNEVDYFIICFFIFSTSSSKAETVQEGLSLLNEGKYEDANEVFKSLSDKGNAKASYWLAYTQFKTSGTLGAGSSLLKAAEGGNPWAMATLAGTHMPKVTTSYCNYLGWPCDEKWVDKAIEGWEKLAEEGDGKAMYALLYHDPSWWQYIPIYSDYRYGKIARKLYENKGFAFFYDSSFWSFFNEEKRVEYLGKMASDGDGVASYKLFHILEENEEIRKAISTIENGIKERNSYALYSASVGLIRLKRTYSIGSKDEKTSKRAYFYCSAADSLLGNNDRCRAINFFDFEYDRNIGMHKYYDKVTGERVTEKQLENIRKEAKEYVAGYHTDLKLDETTVEFFKGYSD